jgi:hypothetical protein
MMMEGAENDLLCFKGFNLNVFRERFKEKASEPEVPICPPPQVFKHIEALLAQSMSNKRTSQYDWFQSMSNGISP